MSIQTQKKKIRLEMIERRKSLNPEQKRDWDRQIIRQLKDLILSYEQLRIHLFIPMGDEVDLLPLIEWILEQKIPCYTSETLKKPMLRHWKLNSILELQNGVFGTKFPRNSELYTGDFDIIIVPALAIDSSGNRIGYGGGYYDVFLGENPKATFVGVAYSFQMIEEIPRESHDIRLDHLITNMD